jgi:hypothetical protein
MRTLMRKPAADLPAPSCCPNCAQPLIERALPYCPACGQETRVRPPSVWEFVQQFGGAYVSTEGALWRTLRLLLTKPGALTTRYLAGQRKRYVLPLRLYLTISLTALLAIRLVPGAGPAVLSVDPPMASQDADDLHIGIGPFGAGSKNGVFFATGCRRGPVRDCGCGWPRRGRT